MMILKDNPGIVSEFDVLVHLWDSFYLRKTVTEQKKKKNVGKNLNKPSSQELGIYIILLRV